MHCKLSLRNLAVILLLLAQFLPVAALASGGPVCLAVSGAKVIGQDAQNSFLGTVSNSSDPKSIFNPFGTYGNEFSAESIWNEFSDFGNKFNPDSPFNEFSATPPMLVKNGKIIGYLSTNRSIPGAISANLLKALCEDAL